MDLNEILVFARVVEAGSFTGAARGLDMPKSTVSRKVSDLEERLGARLLQRTTRKLSLTDVGRTYYRHAARVVAEMEAADLAVTRMQEVPRGLLRLTTPLNVGYLGGITATFLARYPEVRLEVVCTDRVVDLIEEGFDLAVRAGRLPDSTHIARTVGTIRSFPVASPGLLAEHGELARPADLADMPCLVFGAGPAPTRWRLLRGDQERVVTVAPLMTVNDFDFLARAAIDGTGVAMLPAFRCVEPIRQGLLRRVLPEWCSPDVPLHAVYPSTRHLSPKVKAFVEHLADEMTPPPWERGPLP